MPSRRARKPPERFEATSAAVDNAKKTGTLRKKAESGKRKVARRGAATPAKRPRASPKAEAASEGGTEGGAAAFSRDYNCGSQGSFREVETHELACKTEDKKAAAKKKKKEISSKKKAEEEGGKEQDDEEDEEDWPMTWEAKQPHGQCEDWSVFEARCPSHGR
jgi:hypothetical protein